MFPTPAELIDRVVYIDPVVTTDIHPMAPVDCYTIGFDDADVVVASVYLAVCWN